MHDFVFHQEAVKREVEEEAGLTFEPTTLLCVEYGSGYYYRLTFTGHVTGIVVLCLLGM